MGLVGEVQSEDKAKFIVKDLGKVIVFQFNPSRYERSYDPLFSETRAARESGDIGAEYMGLQPGVLSLSLDFDTSGAVSVGGTGTQCSSVTVKTDPIENLTKPVADTHCPPKVEFKWGNISFIGWVTSVKTTYTLFTRDGTPIRAKVDITMKEKIHVRIEKNSPDRTKTRVLSEDTNVWSLARAEYGDVGEWRRIAKANGILNPFEVETGSILLVPAITD